MTMTMSRVILITLLISIIHTGQSKFGLRRSNDSRQSETSLKQIDTRINSLYAELGQRKKKSRIIMHEELIE